MRMLSIVLLSGLLLMCTISNSTALPIANATLHDHMRTTGEPIRLKYEIVINYHNDVIINGYLDASDSTDTWTISSGSTFDHIVDILTNGVNDVFQIRIASDGPEYNQLVSESSFDNIENISSNGIDFEGVNIDNIVFHIGFYENSILGLDGTAGVNASMIVDDGTTVPEPATFFLLGIGFIGLIGVNRKKKAA